MLLSGASDVTRPSTFAAVLVVKVALRPPAVSLMYCVIVFE